MTTVSSEPISRQTAQAGQWEPKIVAFLCNWCSYTGADLAGVSRMKWPPNVRTVRIMCTGRLDPTFVLQAFRQGADGVIISGCHPGDCHYMEGNYKALRRSIFLKRLLKEYGINPRRVELVWVSASEGDRWAQITQEMTETIRKLGPMKLSVTPEVTVSATESGEQ